MDAELYFCLFLDIQHSLQPLDLSFFKPLASYYMDKMKKWSRVNPGRRVTRFQAAAVFGRASCRAASVGHAVSVFAGADTWPVDGTVLQDYDFCASPALQDDSGTCPRETRCCSTGSRSTTEG
jgi:hypothetical protein